MIRLEKIEKVYEGDTFRICALKDVSLSIKKGDFVSIMGRSGSGKTTLLNIIGFLDTPSSGSFFFEGEEVSRISPGKLWRYRRENVGFVFQNFALIDKNTVYENIILPLQAMNIPRREIKRRTNEMMERMGIAELRDMYPAQISGGQKQRTAIARALVGNPKLILADEPTGSLDVRTGDEIMQIFKEINEQGKTIIIVTHDEKIAKLTKRGIRLENSMIAYDERIDKLEDR